MAEGQPFVIWVTFDVKPGAFEEFQQVALEDATDSVQKEPGCLEFNVLVPSGGTDRLSLFEVYKSREAFEEHMKTPHFQKFMAAMEKATSEKHVTEWSMSAGNSKPTAN